MLISMLEVVGNHQGRPQWSPHLLLMALYISLHMNNFPLTNNRQCWWDAISMIRLKLWLHIASRFFLLLLCLRSGLLLWRYQYGKELKRSLVKSQWEYEDLTLTTCGEFKATNNSEGAWKWIFPLANLQMSLQILMQALWEAMKQRTHLRPFLIHRSHTTMNVHCLKLLCSQILLENNRQWYIQSCYVKMTQLF